MKVVSFGLALLLGEGGFSYCPLASVEACKGIVALPQVRHCRRTNAVCIVQVICLSEI